MRLSEKRLNKKAFTLIEVLGVIVIIGIILIVAMPSLSQMIHDNDNEELSNYYVLVDEAQDINWVQYEILLIITEDHNNLFMVGDP